jgi:hypothetical protein
MNTGRTNAGKTGRRVGRAEGFADRRKESNVHFNNINAYMYFVYIRPVVFGTAEETGITTGRVSHQPARSPGRSAGRIAGTAASVTLPPRYH